MRIGVVSHRCVCRFFRGSFCLDPGTSSPRFLLSNAPSRVNSQSLLQAKAPALCFMTQGGSQPVCTGAIQTFSQPLPPHTVYARWLPHYPRGCIGHLPAMAAKDSSTSLTSFSNANSQNSVYAHSCSDRVEFSVPNVMGKKQNDVSSNHVFSDLSGLQVLPFQDGPRLPHPHGSRGR